MVAFEARALGSVLRLHVRLPDQESHAGAPDPGGGDPAARGWDAVRAEFDAVDAALSRFREDSELTRLNRLAGSDLVVGVSWRLRTMLAAVHRAGRLTGGRFDASVLADLERLGERGAGLDGPPPAPGASSAAPGASSAAPGASSAASAASSAATGASSPAGGRTSLVRAPSAPLDSGGIGKGLALRWAAAAALAALPPGAGLLLEAGGDIVSAGASPAGGWQVGIEDPAASGPDLDPVAVVAVERGAVATSSVRVRNWTGPDGRRVHHLVDPRTGEPARTGLIAVTVAGVDPAWSEVWSKALFLAGRDSIGEEARSRGLAAWWVDDAGRLGLTPAARQCSAWVAESRVG